jgi:hypothetical protein
LYGLSLIELSKGNNAYEKKIKRLRDLVEEFGLFVSSDPKKASYSALVYTVRIPGFHPGGPGSIPGCGIFLFLFILSL